MSDDASLAVENPPVEAPPTPKERRKEQPAAQNRRSSRPTR